MPLLDEFSIQLYSVREETKKDFAGALKRIGGIGYTGVEFAGYGGIEAEEMKKILADCGLKSIGSHIGIERLRDHLEEELAYNKIIGTEYIIVPYAKFETAALLTESAEEMAVLAEKCKNAGFKFGYHNHDHEFEKFDNNYILDDLFDKASADNFVMELDMYWASYAGVDALAYMEQNEGRVQLLHIKQIKDLASKKCVDLNEGILDFKKIIEKAKAAGVKHFILEQEEFAVSPYVSIKNGFDYIMGL